MRGRQHAQRTDSVTKYEYNMASPHVWPYLVDPHQDLALGFGPEIRSLSSLFTLTDLSLVVDGDDQPAHCSIEAHSNSKLDEWDIADLASWHHQYPEFGFLRSETDDWMRNGRNVLVCTAPIKLMAEVRLEADLTIAFDLYSHLDLSRYEYMECMMRFYDDGQGFVDSELDSMTHDGKEHRTSCEYRPDSYGSKGVLRVKFDAAFWLTWMKRCGNMSYRDDRSVQDPRLTAVQDIYGIIPGTNEAQCLCTVLWRFQRTRNSAEADSMKWRPFNFVKNRSAAEARWCDEAEDYHEDLGDVEGEHGQVTDVPISTPANVMPYYQTPQLRADLVQTHSSNHSHEIESHHERHPPPLSIDILGSMQSDLDRLEGSAATTTTGFSQQSFALPRNQATLSSSAHDSDFDFSDGHMTTNDVFEPAINISAYGSFLSQGAGLEGLHALAGLENDEFAAMRLAIGEHGQLVPVNANDLQTPTDLACFSIKPNWQHLHLISHLEHAAEQYGPYIDPCEYTKPAQDHENLHGHDVYQRINQREESVATGLHGVHAHADHSLWDSQGLQRSFEERTSSWMNQQKEQAHISEFVVPDLIEKNQRDRGY
jgi:transcriptional enhancer factor